MKIRKVLAAVTVRIGFLVDYATSSHPSGVFVIIDIPVPKVQASGSNMLVKRGYFNGNVSESVQSFSQNLSILTQSKSHA